MAEMSDTQRREIDEAMLESLITWFEMRETTGYTGRHSFNDWDVSDLLARTLHQMRQPTAKNALQVIADLPSNGNEPGHEEAYRAVEALFDVHPQIYCTPPAVS